MARCSRRTGITIVEALVAAALTLLLLGMVFTFLIPAMRAQGRGSARVELEQMAVIALGRISADLDATAAAGLSVAPSPPSLGIVRIAGVASTGAQEWETDMIVYRLEDGRLIREVCPASSALPFTGTAPLQVSASVLAGLDGTEETLASGVTQFLVQAGGTAAAPANPVTVTIRLSRSVGDWDTATGSDQPIQVQMTRTMTMRQQN